MFLRLWREISCVWNQGTWYTVAFLDLNLLSADFFNLIALCELALMHNSHSLFIIIWLHLSLLLYQTGWRSSEIHKKIAKKILTKGEIRCAEREDLGGLKQKPAKTRCQSPNIFVLSDLILICNCGVNFFFLTESPCSPCWPLNGPRGSEPPLQKRSSRS